MTLRSFSSFPSSADSPAARCLEILRRLRTEQDRQTERTPERDTTKHTLCDRNDRNDRNDQTHEVAGRVAAFRLQLEAWRGEVRSGVPLLTLPDAPPPADARCVSCGVTLNPGRNWRCVPCLEAVHIVLGLPPEAGK
jgi:hypothetical protein